MNKIKWVQVQMRISQILNVQIPNESRPNTNTQLSNKGQTTKSQDN